MTTIAPENGSTFAPVIHIGCWGCGDQIVAQLTDEGIDFSDEGHSYFFNEAFPSLILCNLCAWLVEAHEGEGEITSLRAACRAQRDRYEQLLLVDDSDDDALRVGLDVYQRGVREWKLRCAADNARRRRQLIKLVPPDREVP